MNANENVTWKGSQGFRLTSSGLHEDTLRIVPNYRKEEMVLRLRLPTLCVTYADMKFQNAVGGEQENYPASAAYGGTYFDPPVEITDVEEIEKLTYIRGARRVEIGPRETLIEFGAWKDLVVPRLRLDERKPAEAELDVPEISLRKEEPLDIRVMQYADGRHIGGVRLEKRHPDFKPRPVKEVYDLWIRVLDGETLTPIPEAVVDIWHWDRKLRTPLGRGGFRLDASCWTDGSGSVEVAHRPSGELEAYTVRYPGWRVVPRCLRPLAGQSVRLHMRAWKLTPDSVRYTWGERDTLQSMTDLTGHGGAEILSLNRLKDASDLVPGLRINLPCWVGNYQLESWDNPDQVAAAFGYKDGDGLAASSGLRDLNEYHPSAGLKLPDWRFFLARKGDILDSFDVLFGLPEGSARTVGRVFRPDTRLLFKGETVAVPSARFAEQLKGDQEGH